MVTVLVVDDHAAVNKSVCRLLRADGHRAISAFNGEDALALLSADMPDLLLLDVSMPGMSGIDVLKVLRSKPRTASLPVVMFSALADPALRQHALEAGANDYWVKSETDPSRITALIGTLLGTTGHS